MEKRKLPYKFLVWPNGILWVRINYPSGYNPLDAPDDLAFPGKTATIIKLGQCNQKTQINCQPMTQNKRKPRATNAIVWMWRVIYPLPLRVCDCTAAARQWRRRWCEPRPPPLTQARVVVRCRTVLWRTVYFPT